MVLTLKHRRKIYRVFQYDIWGVSFTDAYNVKFLSFLKKKKCKKISLNFFTFFWRFFFKLWFDRKRRFEASKRRYIYRLDVKSHLNVENFFKKDF